MVFVVSLIALAHVACGRKEPPPREKATTAAKAPAAPLKKPALPENAPRLAIVIDDLGRDRAAAARLLALGVPITFSVIPNLPFSADTATEAYRAGREVMLHLPMAANGARGGVPSEPVELQPGMDSAATESMIAAMLQSVPHAAGVNNHQGSQATTNRALMDAVMRALGSRQLYFLDSRTSAASVAYDAAQDAGLRAAYRTEFLDDTPDRATVQRQLLAAERRAREHGWAIAIGHPHTDTLAVLEEALPQFAARGVRLVFVSEIAK